MYKVMTSGIGLAALAAIYAVSHMVWAQGQPPAPPAVTRVAVVNIEALLQNYKKAQIYKTETDKELEPFRKQAEALRKKIGERQVELRIGNFDPAKRKQWEEAVNKDIKKLDELEHEASLRNNRKVEKELVPIYREVLEAIKTYANSKAVQVVLSYAEDPKIDPFSMASIGRKVNGLEGTGCVAALYVDPAVDITAALADMLNRRFKASR
jgi:Skp family chaperone for outer membrane proteins